MKEKNKTYDNLLAVCKEHHSEHKKLMLEMIQWLNHSLSEESDQRAEMLDLEKVL